MIINRGEICIVDLNPVQGSEQAGIRPAIIFQNNEISNFSTTAIIVPLSTNLRRASLPTCVFINSSNTGLEHNSVALCHQLRAIDKSRIKKIIGKLNQITLFELEATILLTLGFS